MRGTRVYTSGGSTVRHLGAGSHVQKTRDLVLRSRRNMQQTTAHDLQHTGLELRGSTVALEPEKLQHQMVANEFGRVRLSEGHGADMMGCAVRTG